MNDNKVAIVKGGGRGLGRGIPLRLAADGFRVAVIYQSGAKDAQTVVTTILQNGGQAIVARADVSDDKNVTAFTTEVLQRYGRIDVLVNNAGIAYKANTVEVSEKEWDHVRDVKLKSAFSCQPTVIPEMVKQGGGSIIHMSSVSAQIGVAIDPHYAASKAGMIGLMRHQARELGPNNITVNAVAPANITTDMLSSLGLSPTPPRPIQRIGTVDNVAAAVSFLASNDASFITGHIVSVTGGSYFG